MNLSVVHLGLLTGLAFVAVPVIIHMVMRQKPKHIFFPALRLLKLKQRQSTRRLRIRQWALLASRMAVIALMALCLARPACNTTAPLGESNVPAAIALVIDTSLSMQWTDARNRDRLTEAKELARKIVRETPITSQIFLIDSAEPIETPAMSPSTAESRIKALELKAANRPLNDAIDAAFKSVKGSDRPRREVYVMTDLAESSLDLQRPMARSNAPETGKAEETPIQLYLLRLDPQQPVNVGLKNLEFDASAAVVGEPLDIKLVVSNTGPATTRILELWMDGRKRDQRAVELSADADSEIVLRTPPLEAGRDGLHQGEIRIRDEDPMPFDNTAFFTFVVRPPVNVLIVSDLEQDALYLAEALDPARGAGAQTIPGVSRPFRVEIVRVGQLSDRLKKADARPNAILINNVAQIPEPLWTQLNLAVRSGVGLCVALGNRSRDDSYNGATAMTLLPATADSRFEAPAGEPLHFGSPDTDHPIFSQYAEELRTELTTVPVFRYWRTTRSGQGSRELLQFSDGNPALIERVFDASVAGRILYWTTPLARRPSSTDAAAWNDFPRSWSFVQIVNRMTAYLADTEAQTAIIEAGQDYLLPVESDKGFSAALVKGPGDRPGERRDIGPSDNRLPILRPDVLGHWGVALTGAAGVARSTGFSVNPPGKESQLRAVPAESLDSLFGKGTYALAQDTDSLEKAVGLARVGVEFYPWLMLLLLVVLSFENYLANRFYKDDPNITEKPPASGMREVTA